jgi:integrase/recombinase XerD
MHTIGKQRRRQQIKTKTKAAVAATATRTKTTTTLNEGRKRNKNKNEVKALGGAEYDIFIDSIRSPQTRTQYSYAILQYLRFHKLTSPSELMFSGDIKVIERSLINYAMDMRKRVSYSTRANYCSAVIAFYAMNDVLLNRKKIYKYLGEYEKVHRDRAYTTEEIAKLLHFCDQRLKAIVLFLASSGSRLGSLPTLRVGNLVPISEYKLYKITIYESSREEYYTFCTPEARRAIDEYLQFRERCGEKLGPDSPLFREQFDVNDKENSVNKPRPITSYGIQTTLTNALIKAGLRVRVTQQTEDNDHKNTGRVRKEVARFHGFRKYCVTNMKNASLDFSDREYLVGHRKSRGLDVNYDRTSESQRLEQYLKAVDLLTIDDSHRLRLKVDSLEKKNSEIELLKRRISESEQINLQTAREFKQLKDYLTNEAIKAKQEALQSYQRVMAKKGIK